MNISYDNSVDAMYIKLKEGEFRENREVSPGIVLDIGQNDDVLGIEILEASTRFDVKENLAHVTFELPVAKAVAAA